MQQSHPTITGQMKFFQCARIQLNTSVFVSDRRTDIVVIIIPSNFRQNSSLMYRADSTVCENVIYNVFAVRIKRNLVFIRRLQTINGVVVLRGKYFKFKALSVKCRV